MLGRFLPPSMTTIATVPVHQIKTIMAEHLPCHGDHISFLARFLLVLIKVRSVNLVELATGSGKQAKVVSKDKRLQRCFRTFEFDYDGLAQRLVRLVPIVEGS